MRQSTSTTPSNGAPSTAAAIPGVIKPDEFYTLDELKRRLRFRDAALRAARRQGLRVYRVHGRGFVLGQDWIDYVLKAHGREETNGGGHD